MKKLLLFVAFFIMTATLCASAQIRTQNPAQTRTLKPGKQLT
jgi:hypothetical protein